MEIWVSDTVQTNETFAGRACELGRIVPHVCVPAVSFLTQCPVPPRSAELLYEEGCLRSGTWEDIGSKCSAHVFWLDIFFKNQHAIESDGTMEELANSVETIGTTVVVCHPMPAPLTLRRSWCLFEVYISGVVCPALLLLPAILRSCSNNAPRACTIPITAYSALEPLSTVIPEGFCV